MPFIRLKSEPPVSSSELLSSEELEEGDSSSEEETISVGTAGSCGGWSCWMVSLGFDGEVEDPVEEAIGHGDNSFSVAM